VIVSSSTSVFSNVYIGLDDTINSVFSNAYLRLDVTITSVFSNVYLRLDDTIIKVITKLPNSEQSYKGKVQTHNYINRQNQST
jgi:hypothetical protein